MSLVICSNNAQDGTISRQADSIDEAFSFRNTLSSTYNIPRDSQVALQSCKVNIDGRMTFSRNNHRLYQYFGEKLNLDGTTSPQSDDTTSHPLLLHLTQDSTKDSVEELAPADFANRLSERLNETIYHPNVKNQISAEVLRNASSLDFKGFKIIYDQINTGGVQNKPATNFLQWYREDGVYDGTTPTFAYDPSTHIFQRGDIAESVLSMGTGIDKPLSCNGSFAVNLSSATSDVQANGSECEWVVGLSRWVNNVDMQGYKNPRYYSKYDNWGGLGLSEQPYVDFGVARNLQGQLVVFQSSYSSTSNATYLSEVEYWNNASSEYTSLSDRLDLTGGQYTSVRFTTKGEQMKLEIYDAKNGPEWKTVVDYLSTTSKSSMFKPINQSCWCLHPVLMVGSDNTTNQRGKMHIGWFTGVSIDGYDPKVKNKGGWFETMELLNRSGGYCLNVESRKWNEPTDSLAYAQKGLNGSGGVAYNNVLILQQSEIYKPSFGANATQILGFNRGVVDTAVSVVGSQVTFESVSTPDLTSSMSLFVRLNNLGQNVMNAFTGNNSRILSHLCDLETQSGRKTYEPNELIWLDLNNPADMNITEFDISFTYINEQYARILCGQSIVCLYFRDKPK